MVLDQINDVNDIKKLNEEELEALRAEIRHIHFRGTWTC